MDDKLSNEVKNFDDLPNSALIRIKHAVILSARCRQTLYREVVRGKLATVRLGGSTRIRAGELRRYMAGTE